MAQSIPRRPSLDEVLHLVEQLPEDELEQLRSQLERKIKGRRLPAMEPRAFIDWKINLDALAKQQGAATSVTLESLKGDFWPEDEDVEEFVATIRQWRQGVHSPANIAARRLDSGNSPEGESATGHQ